MGNRVINKAEPFRFVYQTSMYSDECIPCTAEVFDRFVDSPETAWKISTRQAVEKALNERGPLDIFVQDPNFKSFCEREEKKVGTGKRFKKLTEEERLQLWATSLKQSLPCFIFGAGEFDKLMKPNWEGRMRPVSRRLLSGIHLSGLFMFDADHLVVDPREVFIRTQVEGFPWKVLLAHKTSSGQGLRLVIEARPEVGNWADCQIEVARDLGLLGMKGSTGKPVVDNSCIDASRISYCPRREDIYFIDYDGLFNPSETDKNTFEEKFGEAYRNGQTAPTNPNHSFDSDEVSQPVRQVAPTKSEKHAPPSAAMPELYGHPVSDFIQALLPNGAPVNSRHKEALKLANDLIILLDGNKEQARMVLLSQSWVQTVVSERGQAEIDRIMEAAQKHFQKREEENLYSPQPSKRMQKAIEKVTKKNYRVLQADIAKKTEGVARADEDILKYVNNLGREIKKMFRYYPLLPLLCHGLKPKHFIAALFAGGAYGMTLLTRCWYLFYGAPGRKCRMNCIMELIGPPGSGKGFLVDLYRIMMEPIKKADEKQITALNKWKEEQITKGANKDKSACPRGVLRCLPAESSAAAIRDAMVNAKEVIDGEEWPLHVFLFDPELDNSIRQMKKSYMDIATLYLKAFHNEPHGSMLKTTSSTVGEYDVHMNAVYSGTEFAFNKQVNKDNYSTGLYGRLSVVPQGYTNYEMMDNRKYTNKDKQRDDMLKEWSYKLDKAKGEIPVQMLSDKLYEWTANRMEDAKEDDSKVDEDLLKRCAWHGINYAIPFIVSRHWNEMTEDNGYWKPGAGFKIDKTDWKLCQLIVNAQFVFQHYFVGAIAEKYHEEKAVIEASNHRLQPRTKEAYLKLPDIFVMEDVMKCYGYTSIGGGCSRLKRLVDDNLAEKIRQGENKGKYRKLA